MPETWIGLNAGARRRNWWWTAVLSLLFVGLLAVACFEESWPWLAAIGAAWVGALFYMINRGYGRTLLTPDGMKFHTFVSRRAVAWSEVTSIERKSRTTRSGQWWEVRAMRASGRSLAIPGILTARRHDPLFEQNLAAVREYWSRAQRGDISE
ncbi:hypothetical protein [Streptomyces sp. NPDC059753]|uniref:hypothetical protein n=1 Tax=Streptomyces sp. NPDC059753 TaxID=3346933 RepID=UPI0036694655